MLSGSLTEIIATHSPLSARKEEKHNVLVKFLDNNQMWNNVIRIKCKQQKETVIRWLV